MERVNVKIGSLTFDHADYDDENDILYLHIGEPQPAEGEDTPEGHCVRYRPGTQTIVGLTMLWPQHFLDKDGGTLTVTIDEPHKATAEDLAPGFAAV